MILGASGFIGRHLAQNFASAGYGVIAATRHDVSFEHPRIRNVVSDFVQYVHSTNRTLLINYRD